MVDTDSILRAKRRDVSRVVVGFAGFVVLLLLVMGLWQWDTATSRDYWRTDAGDTQQAYDDLLSDYTSLYDEYVAKTGDTPGADAPEDVAEIPSTLPGPQGEQGPPGAQGVPGPQGPQGKKGTRGTEGAAGKAGDAGTPGATGDAGATGSAGPTGPVGPKGDTGGAGATGPVGPKGDTGSTGPKGDTGDVGATGPAGPACPDGYTPGNVWISVAETEFGTFHRQQATVCLPEGS